MSEMPILEHLRELRTRLVRALAGVLVGFLACYSFSETIFDWLIQPLCTAYNKPDCPIVYTGVAEPFMVYLKLGFIGGIFVSAPWIFFQAWQFISPGLHSHEKRYVVPFVSVASLMFVGGGLLGYFFIFPFAFDYFVHIAPVEIQPMISMSDYFGFASGLLLAFGILFEIPVFVVLLNLIGVLRASTLWRTWRMALAIIFVMSAVLTPQDPYTMLLLGVPLSVLYMLALVFCSLLERAKRPPNDLNEAA
jgi:sec-independent protein translocase protein TatC